MNTNQQSTANNDYSLNQVLSQKALVLCSLVDFIIAFCMYFVCILYTILHFYILYCDIGFDI